MTSFLTPIIAEFSAKLEAAVELAKANILAELDGVSQARAGASSNVRQAAAPARKLTARGGGLAKGQKRTPEALALKVEEVFTLIQRHPGLRIEQLGERSGLTTKEMSLPIKKLRAAKRIAAAGEKRATTYSARATK